MAIDFQEETLHKKVLTYKCAKEAQRFIIQKSEAVKAKKREEEERIHKEENEKLERER